MSILGQPTDLLDIALARIEMLEKERDRNRFLFSYALRQLGEPLKIPRDEFKEAKIIPFAKAIFDFEGYVGFQSKESHNATPAQHENATDAENSHETDS